MPFSQESENTEFPSSYYYLLSFCFALHYHIIGIRGKQRKYLKLKPLAQQ